MSESNGDSDILDRATDALRNEDVPRVPPGLIGRTQFAVRGHAAVANCPHAGWRAAFRHPLVRVAAAVVALACGLVVYLALPRPGDPVETALLHPDGAVDRSDTAPEMTVIGGNPTDPAPGVVRGAGDAIVRGRVRFAGPVPQVTYLSMADNAHCAAHHDGRVEDESVVVNPDGTLRNVVIWVSGGLEGRTYRPPPEPAVLDQQGCVYTPHVVTVMAGQQLLVKNSDPFLHNVRAAASKNHPFNFAQPTVSRGKPLVFDAPERLFVKCDIHPWMSAFIHVMDNPFFAVTGDGGAFAMPPGLPPGEYEVSAWHEVYGEQRQSVRVEPGEPVPALQFTFKPEQGASTTNMGAATPPSCCDTGARATVIATATGM